MARKKKLNENLNILVAGCGSYQAALIAKRNPKNFITGVDLSKSSIFHEEQLKNKYNLNNLDLICDDFRKLKFPKKFDLIISTGVIHHLEEPESAVQYFVKYLKEDGVIYLMVYGSKIRSELNEVKKVFKYLGLNQDKESIEICKSIFNSLDDKHPAKIYYKNSPDINHDNDIVDLLLHKQEKFYDIQDVISMLDSNDLIIKNFTINNIYSVTNFFLRSPKALKKFNQLPINKKLEIGQILNWDDKKIDFCCCFKQNLKYSIIYNRNNLDSYYFILKSNVKYDVKKKEIFFEKKNSNATFKFNFKNQFNLKDYLQGKITGKDFFSDYDHVEKDNLVKFINILYESNLAEFSFHPK